MNESRSPSPAGKPIEKDDPLELVGTFVNGGSPLLMALSLIEEFARMGFDEGTILRLFSSPAYRTNSLYRSLGEACIRGLIGEVLGRTGRLRIKVHYPSRGNQGRQGNA